MSKYNSPRFAGHGRECTTIFLACSAITLGSCYARSNRGAAVSNRGAAVLMPLQGSQFLPWGRELLARSPGEAGAVKFPMEELLNTPA